MPHPFDLAPIATTIWQDKYRFTDADECAGDASIDDTWRRVARAAAEAETTPDARRIWMDRFCNAMSNFAFLPGGRIIAGAGTDRRVTLFNCFVLGTIPDTLSGIFEANREAALTMQQGGGIGHDFSTLRPRGAPLKATGATASGPVSFMDVWDSMCRTVMSAGARRGAMMATLRCDHPDIAEFIAAKRTAGQLTNFNMSVLVTDAFIDAVRADAPWPLTFDGTVYETVQARDLWRQIMESTYAHAEPGVIFIDRVNARNNLSYCENIAATNPCGEQPLPPYGACLLGAINLTQLIDAPFTSEARLDRARLEQLVQTAVRLLDNVIDVSGFPLEAQRREAHDKRRIGLGVTGLANALAMCGARYGGTQALQLTDTWLRTLKVAAYRASADLAEEKGAFPAFAAGPMLDAPNLATLPNDLRAQIGRTGLRNGCLTTIAPTGTISLLAGNVSSGIEPVFADRYERRILEPDGAHRTVVVEDYAVALHKGLTGHDLARDIQPGMADLTPADHIAMQRVAQRHIDSAISKTINCPEDMPFDDFEAIYLDAFDAGLKGCTTYRPNPTTGAVLVATSGAQADAAGEPPGTGASSPSHPAPDTAPAMMAAVAVDDDLTDAVRANSDLTNIVYLPGTGARGTASGTGPASDAVGPTGIAAAPDATPSQAIASVVYTVPLETGATLTVVVPSIAAHADADERTAVADGLVFHTSTLGDQIWLTGLANLARALLRAGHSFADVANLIARPNSAQHPAGNRTDGLLMALAGVLRTHDSVKAAQQTAAVADGATARAAGSGEAVGLHHQANQQIVPQAAPRSGAATPPPVTSPSRAAAAVPNLASPAGASDGSTSPSPASAADSCPNCGAAPLMRLEGCWVCHTCGAAACG
ncbi:MAG: adenosylcobalamin-dependent ribonucleoside-diphosphate reductase [Pseudomonadota bacterium]